MGRPAHSCQVKRCGVNDLSFKKGAALDIAMAFPSSPEPYLVDDMLLIVRLSNGQVGISGRTNSDGTNTLFYETAVDYSNNNSFPSGHTSAAFSGATFIHKRYGFNKACPIYIVASFVGYSRVYAEKHYWEDVLAGAILAGINTWIFTSPLLDNAGASIQENQINLQFRF